MQAAIPLSSLTIQHAMVGPSLAAIEREHGKTATIAHIVSELDAINQVTGSGLNDSALALCAELVYDRFKLRTVNALRLALRDGLNSGKIFGKLTYPLIAEWLTVHEDAVEAMNYSQHLATK